MVTRMHIVLERQADSGSVALFENKRFLCGGDAVTDLRTGKYQLVADFGRKEWKINGVGARSKAEHIRFTLDLDGPDPFKLSYSNPIELEITNVVTAEAYMPDPFIEMLPDVGPDVFRKHPDYVDNGLAVASFDVASQSMTLTYQDGSTLSLTSHVSWADLVEQGRSGGNGTIHTYYRLKPPALQKILPRRFDKACAPTIAAMVAETVAAIPGALIGQKLARILLDFVQLGPRPLGAGPKGAPGVAARPMRMRVVPKDRIKPVGGTVNVGGGLEKGSQSVTNLNPIVPGTGGPTAHAIPNHVQAGFEDMGDIFMFGSVQKVMSNRLPFQTVNWTQSATAASKVMAPGGQLQLNVWTRSQAEVDQIIKAFTDAGFKNVRNMTPKPFDVGAGTVIVGTK